MSSTRDAVRRSVARVLAFRHYRTRILLAVVASEVALLLLMGAATFLHLILPVVSLPLLVPYVVFGRTRLPDAEWQGWEHEADAAAMPGGRRCGKHQYLDDASVNGEDEEREVVLAATRGSHGIRGGRAFLVVETDGVLLLVTPRSYWLQRGGDVRHGDARGIGVELLAVTDQVRLPRADDELLGSTWLHATKRGERDMRYRDNHEFYEVRRHMVALAIGEESWTILLYSWGNAVAFANALLAMVAPGCTYDEEEDAQDEDDEDYDEDEDGAGDDGDCGGEEDDDEGARRPWHDVLGVSPDAAVAEIRAAYRERLKEYHPDRVAHLGEKLRQLAAAEATAINVAYAEAIQRVRMQG